MYSLSHSHREQQPARGPQSLMEIFDFPCSESFRRLHEFWHKPGCTCERCWVRIERAILQYLPGLLPETESDRRIVELEQALRAERAETQRLRKENQRLASRQEPQRNEVEIPILCRVPE